MKPPAGFIVVGNQGVMAKGRHGCLSFGVQKGTVATVFDCRAAAKQAIRATANMRKDAGHEGDFVKDAGVRIVRLESAR
jgi:hypothetical protein